MKNILIEVRKNSTKVCVVENGTLVEFWVERKSINKLVGNIYKGKITNVLPGMQAAFVNIGLERNGFLFSGDTIVYGEEIDVVKNSFNYKVGDVVLCQVTKDQFGNKGARLTMNISIPGRVLVIMPQLDYIGISRKITDLDKRAELTEFIDSIRPKGCGFILRTQSAEATKEEIEKEMNYLVAEYERIKNEHLAMPCPSLVYSEEDLIVRSVRDMYTSDTDKIIINDEKMYEKLKGCFPYLIDKNNNLFEYYSGQDSLINYYGLTQQVSNILKKKVVMKNGSYLVIDRTEALTVIDVNTGKFVGEKNLEETVFETNCAAAEEIAKQLLLRNIGGIVIVDFIDMENEEHIQKVLETLQNSLAKDRIKTTLIGMTPLGLVQLTRKKTRSALESVMLQTCPYCNGDGYVYSDEHVITLLRDEINATFDRTEANALIVKVAPSVFSKLFTYRYLEKECANEWQNKRIYVIADKYLHIEKYEIEVVRTNVIDLPDNAKLLY